MRVCPRCALRETNPDRDRCLVCNTELVERDDPRLGDVLAGCYRLESVIGEGGMSTVYRARHTMMNRPYAVKVLKPELAQDESLVERMRREGRSTAAMSHPNILEVYDFGFTADGAPYLVMELLQGEPLRSLVREGPVPLPLLVELATQTARGLARAHDFGVVHRDLKPENIFVSDDADGTPHVRIVDFGISRSPADSHLTMRGEIVGTPQYMAPERATSRDVTASSDLYSLGVVLYEMATGVMPFQSNNPTGFVLKHLHEQPPPPSRFEPSVSPELQRLILDLMEKDPDKRPVDAHQVIERLRALSPTGNLSLPRASQVPLRSPHENTTTLDGWSFRVGLLEQVLEQAFPGGSPPNDLSDALAQLRGAVSRMKVLQSLGVGVQAELDELEQEGRDASERLGHAVHVIAKDLSRARDEVRSAGQEREERESRAGEAKALFHVLLHRLQQMTTDHPEHPEAELVEASRELSDAAESWRRADAAVSRSVGRDQRSREEAKDLEFQLNILRDRLERLDVSIGDRADVLRSTMTGLGDEMRALQARFFELGERCIAPLRSRPELRELISILDGETARPSPNDSSAPPP